MYGNIMLNPHMLNPETWCYSFAQVKLKDILSLSISQSVSLILPERKTVLNAMGYFLRLTILVSALVVITEAENSNLLLNNLFREIKTALNAEGQTRQQYYPYRPQNNGISLGVYDALRSIAKNDELECISRLLCEAAAGGQPGHSGKGIKFDKLALTKLISYLKLDTSFSSPLLVYGKAALLGVSNHGDPYSCIINYPKCPKDQTRLLYYLNNHRGGFFQYFDKQYSKPGNYYYQNQYRPFPTYQHYRKQFKRNKIQFEKTGSLYEKFKDKANSDIYATKYTHSSLNFLDEDHKRNKPMVFPSNNGLLDPRILTNSGGTPEENDFFSFNRFPKKLNDLNFFPQRDQEKSPPAAVATDRLPSRFYFPENEEPYLNYPIRYSPSSFFPTS